jgi:hypothetical protein
LNASRAASWKPCPWSAEAAIREPGAPVILVCRSLGERDDVVEATGAQVELCEGDGGAGRGLELLDDVDRALEVLLVLTKLSERDADRVSADDSSAKIPRRLRARLASRGTS